MSAYPNIFKINTKSNLNKMINKNKHTLIILIYVSPTDESCKLTYAPIKQLSKKYLNYYFVFIDITRFDDLTNEHYEVQYVPSYFVYHEGIPISQYIGLTFDLIESQMDFWTKKIIKPNKEIEMEINMNPPNNKQTLNSSNLNTCNSAITTPSKLLDQNESNDELNEKAKYLRALLMLTKKGVKLTNAYDMSCDLDEIIWEYNLHTDPSKLQVNSTYKKPIVNDKINDKINDTLSVNILGGNKNISKQTVRQLEIAKLLKNPKIAAILANGFKQKIKKSSNANKSNDNTSDSSSNNSGDGSSDSDSDSDSDNDSNINSNNSDNTSSDSYTSSE